MRKTFFRWLLVIPVLAAFMLACNDDLEDRVSKLEDRVTELDTLYVHMNKNVSSLQSIVLSLQSGDYITSVTPVRQNGIVTGYTISFCKERSHYDLSRSGRPGRLYSVDRRKAGYGRDLVLDAGRRMASGQQ